MALKPEKDEQRGDRKKIVVMGSVNWEVFLRMNRLELGKKLGADDDVIKAFTGKGANQAMAASRLLKGTHDV